jgi:putative acetyltransferase
LKVIGTVNKPDQHYNITKFSMEPQAKALHPSSTASPKIAIDQDSTSQPDVRALLEAHIAAFTLINSANNQFGHLLDLSGLMSPKLTIFTARDPSTQELMGCAAIKEISSDHGELKSMRTIESHLRKGVAAALVKHLINVAKERGYIRLSLETGEQADFAAARLLYERSGFAACEPYEGYEDGVPVEGSVFMTLRLA